MRWWLSWLFVDQLYFQCSYEPDTACSESSTDNERDVQQFQSEFGEIGKNYSCLYNPDDSGEVIVTRAASTSQIVLMMAWPSLLLVSSVVIIVAAHCYVGARNICHMFRIVNKKGVPTSLSKRRTTTTTRRFKRKPLLLHPVWNRERWHKKTVFQVLWNSPCLLVC